MKGAGDFSIGSKVWPGLSKLVEEMGELQQVLGKLVGTGGKVNHWDGTNLHDRLKEEIADVQAALAFFVVKNFTTKDDLEIGLRGHDKVDLFCKWHDAETVKDLK
jgi:hypothetical protein